jgi:hypothetical protein
MLELSPGSPVLLPSVPQCAVVHVAQPWPWRGCYVLQPSVGRFAADPSVLLEPWPGSLWLLRSAAPFVTYRVALLALA